MPIIIFENGCETLVGGYDELVGFIANHKKYGVNSAPVVDKERACLKHIDYTSVDVYTIWSTKGTLIKWIESHRSYEANGDACRIGACL